MIHDFEQRIIALESNLLSLSRRLQETNEELQITQQQWEDLVALHAELIAQCPQENEIVYQSNFDQKRQSQLLDLDIQASEKSKDEIVFEVNKAVYLSLIHI